jgi:hypothetical protein
MIRNPLVRNRHGAMFVWFAVLLPVLLIFIGFAIDIGLIYLTRTELQSAADSAALAAAQELPGFNRERQATFTIATAQEAALTYARRNLPADRHGEILDTSEMEFGQWDYVERQFLVDEQPYTAVRLKARKTEANGNPMSLLFLAIIQESTQDLVVESTAVAAPRLGGWMSGGLIGIESGRVTGETYADGYDSTLGYYGGDNVLSSGVTTNGPMKVDGGPFVEGLAKPGVGYGDAQVDGNSIVTGDTTERFNDIELNFVEFPSPPTSSLNNNSQIYFTGSGASYTGAKALKLDGYDVLTIPRGDYWFSSLIVEGQSLLTIQGGATPDDPTIVIIDGDLSLAAQSKMVCDGYVEVYISGDMSITGQGIVNVSQDPQQFKIFSNGETCYWAGGSDFYGWIYSPSAALDIAGSSQFFGGGAGKTVLLRGNVQVHTDRTVGFWDQNDPIARLVW